MALFDGKLTLKLQKSAKNVQKVAKNGGFELV
jgi:hypothetical protein